MATATTTATAGPAAHFRNPKDSMKSTWRTDPSQWAFAHKTINFLDAHPTWLDRPIPVFQKTDPIPRMSEWSAHAWIISHALWPLAIMWAHWAVLGRTLHPVLATVLIKTAFLVNGIHEARILRRLGHQIGFLDGDKHPRDQVPDVGVVRALRGVQMTTLSRAIFTIFLGYDTTAPPMFSWWLPVELALYSVVLDLFFYTYHRACHEVASLWQYHRTHHLTKHPTPLLSSYADHEQEFIEMVLVPLLTYFTLKAVGLPMGFADWWLCHEYIIFAEAFGHSGVRVYATTPAILTPVLRALGMELQIEDHDLHHRHGWRKSANYGKQTRVWDRLFGTCGERIESQPSNLRPDVGIDMPLW